MLSWGTKMMPQKLFSKMRKRNPTCEYLKVESPDRYIHKVQAMIDALPKSGGILRLDNLMD